MLKTRKENISPGRIAWNRFIKNRVAMLSLIWILLNAIAALLGYLITPDSTPYANSQHLEISAARPGSRIDFVGVTKNAEIPRRNLFEKMLYGQEARRSEIPYSTYRFSGADLLVERYTSLEQGLEQSYSLADVVFSIDSVNSTETHSLIFHQSGDIIDIDNERLKTEIEQHHLFSRTYWLGTDRFGRDLLSQVIIGARISLSVGFIAIIIALILGILLGSLAGFYRGQVDNFIIWLINVVWSVPTLLLVIAITFALGKGFWQIFIAVGLTMWVDVARVVRGQIISLRENEYIEAAKALGLPGLRIIRKHLLPNIVGPVVVISAANFASAILIEAGLSFLGIGVQPPMPSWGSMIRENYGFIILDKAFLAMIPGIAIMMLVMAFMLVGNGLRDALDKSPINY